MKLIQFCRRLMALAHDQSAQATLLSIAFSGLTSAALDTVAKFDAHLHYNQEA